MGEKGRRAQGDQPQEAREGIACWRQFHRELRDSPDVTFSDARGENTLWNFWSAMGNERDGHSQSGKGNRGFIERVLSKDLADRFQKAFAAAWRRTRQPHASIRARCGTKHDAGRLADGLGGYLCRGRGSCLRA